MSEQTPPQRSLNFQDLLHDDSNDLLSEYLRVSISNDGQNTHVSISTVTDQPVVYSEIFHGSAVAELSEILADQDWSNHDNQG